MSMALKRTHYTGALLWSRCDNLAFVHLCMYFTGDVLQMFF